MKALTLIQPWATLILTGQKVYETRSWVVPHRGPLLIHAGKKYGPHIDLICAKEPFQSILKTLGFTDLTQLPRSALLGKVTLESIHKAEDVREAISDQEKAFGDFRNGRYAWKLSDPVIFEEPIPYSGKMKLFDVPDKLIPQSHR